MSDRISLRGIRVHAHHGVYASEREQGQTFLVDVDLSIDLSEPAATDELDVTVDYGALAGAIAERVTGERWDLIERVAQRVADLVLERPGVTSVEVTVHKPEVEMPVPVDDVSVTIHRSR